MEKWCDANIDPSYVHPIPEACGTPSFGASFLRGARPLHRFILYVHLSLQGILKRGRALLATLLLLGIAACSSSTDPVDPVSNELHFSLYSFDTLRTTATTPVVADSAWWERDFPADSVAALYRSVTLVARLGSSDTAADCIVDLFNLTDSTVIPGSELRWSAIPKPRDSNSVSSGNLINAIPRKRFILALRIRSTDTTSTAEVRNAELVYLR